MQNLNDKYIKDFNTALNIYENNYSHDYLIELLKNGSDVEKQAAALKLDNINTQEEADIIMDNLTGCDGKIREAVSFRLKEFIPQNPQFYIKYNDIFIEAIIDINGNICRNTLYALQYLKTYPEFCINFCTAVSEKTFPLISKVKAFDIQEGKYKINKEIFKLYWYLETICIFSEFCDKTLLKQILTETKNIMEYTIREKTAKILANMEKDEELMNLQQELKNDKNYYVRRL